VFQKDKYKRQVVKRGGYTETVSEDGVVGGYVWVVWRGASKDRMGGEAKTEPSRVQAE
jgi:hypothetical protein